MSTNGFDAEILSQTFANDIEQKVINTALEFAKKNIIDVHIDNVLEARANFPLGKLDIISSNISLKQDIPAAVRNDISSFKDKLKAIIERAALEIENCRYSSAEEAISNMSLPYNQKDQVSKLIAADKQINVSFQSLRVTADLFSGLNDYIVRKLANSEKRDNAGEELELTLANAILVYELSDFVIEYLKSTKLQGSQEIANTQRYMDQQLTQLEKEEEKLRQRIEAKEGGGENVRQQILSDIVNRENAISIVREEWSNYMSSIGDLGRSLDVAKKEIPTLEWIRDNARNQINVLEAAAVMQIIKNNLTALQSTIVTLEQIKLVTLTPDRVRRLLNIANR